MKFFVFLPLVASILLQDVFCAEPANLDDLGSPESIAPIVSLIQKTLSDFAIPVDDTPPFVTLDSTRSTVDADHPPKSPASVKSPVSGETKIPANLSPEAAFAPILQLIRNSFLNMPIPNRDAANFLIPLSSPRLSDDKFSMQTDYLPGMRVHIMHKSYTPPAQTVVTSGNINGRNVNQFEQKQMYSSQDFAILQPDTGSNSKEEKVSQNDKTDDEHAMIPKDIVDDLETFVKMTDDMKYQMP